MSRYKETKFTNFLTTQYFTREIEYFNGRGSFIDANTVKSVNKRGKESLIKSKNFVISVGGRPSLPNVS